MAIMRMGKFKRKPKDETIKYRQALLKVKYWLQQPTLQAYLPKQAEKLQKIVDEALK